MPSTQRHNARESLGRVRDDTTKLVGDLGGTRVAVRVFLAGEDRHDVGDGDASIPVSGTVGADLGSGRVAPSLERSDAVVRLGDGCTSRWGRRSRGSGGPRPRRRGRGGRWGRGPPCGRAREGWARSPPHPRRRDRGSCRRHRRDRGWGGGRGPRAARRRSRPTGRREGHERRRRRPRCKVGGRRSCRGGSQILGRGRGEARVPGRREHGRGRSRWRRSRPGGSGRG